MRNHVGCNWRKEDAMSNAVGRNLSALISLIGPFAGALARFGTRFEALPQVTCWLPWD